METIYGYLERISYCNEETNFVVAKLKEKGKRELSSIVGKMVGVNPGESLQLTGRWLHNPKFGLQFQVDEGLDEFETEEADNDPVIKGADDGSNVVTVDFGRKK